jgi:hypothetical protein
MLTDTAGQEEYRSLWAASNLRSDAFLLVYDITNPHSLDGLEYFTEMIDMEEENRLDQGKVPPVKIVAGNKCDLQGARVVKSKDGLEWARKRGCGFMETSAREMVNIEETFARELCWGRDWMGVKLTGYRSCETRCGGTAAGEGGRGRGAAFENGRAAAADCGERGCRFECGEGRYREEVVVEEVAVLVASAS